ncbi:MAG: LacI family DNA-binding transcriptional regulator [Actinomycetaceae bacterium]|nr:LacI family DNA-binding transcriptional regulator [Actinomycetaceae bacterium]
MSKNRTRMSDIAVHAGVSIATVSRVVNGTGQVSDDTRHRVLVAIDSLGYERPSFERTQSSRSIAIVTPELVNPVFASYAHQLQVEISRSGGLPLICTQTPGATSEEDFVHYLVDSGVAGIIFVSGRHADSNCDLTRYLRLQEAGFPFVTINGARDALAAPDFSTDDAAGIRAAVSHLVGLGHSRIALLGGRGHITPASRKISAFRSACLELLGQKKPPVAETFYTYEAAAAAAKQLLSQGVTALLCGSDLQALGAIRTAHAQGLSVPGDLSVIGFDDTILMGHVEPPLTTIRQPIQAIATAAVQSLWQLFDQEETPPSSFEYTPDLVVRSSTAPPKTSRALRPARLTTQAG